MKSIINIKELQLLMATENIIFLDATIDKVTEKIDNSNAEYIPNSILFDTEGVFSDKKSGLPHTMLSAEDFTTAVQSLGINAKDTIVVYDRWGVYSSPRAWWMFRYMGHEKVFVLNGGIHAWKEAGLPTVKSLSTATIKGNFISKPQTEWFETKDSILRKLHSEHITITDARGTTRFLGTTAEPRAGVRSGHIPKSSNVPFDTLLDGPYLKNKEQIATIFEGHLSDEKENIFTCGSGITAAILAVAAHNIGTKKIAVYDGSWAEWGSDQTLPIE